jgi:hypothetical protein
MNREPEGTTPSGFLFALASIFHYPAMVVPIWLFRFGIRVQCSIDPGIKM